MLRLAAVLDFITVADLRAAIDERPSRAALVIDLRELTFLDSTGIQILLTTFWASRGANPWPFALVPGALTQRVFRIASLESLFRWVDDPEDVFRSPTDSPEQT